jgi:hypothetical protein
MTQLDQITWFSQIVVLLAVFFTIYTLIYTNFGPVSFRNQNYQSTKVGLHYSSIISYDYLNADVLFKRFSLIFNNF